MADNKFSMEYFITLNNKQAREEYLNRHLINLGCGSSRCVHLTDKNTILKVAKPDTAKGVSQNKVEASLHTSKNPTIPELISSDPQGRWIEVERLYPLSKDDFHKKANISSLDDLIDRIESYLGGVGEKPSESKFSTNLADLIKSSGSFSEKLGIAIGDYRVYEHYGLDKEGNIKLKDYGLNWANASRYYTNLENRDITLPTTIEDQGNDNYVVRNELGGWLLGFGGHGQSKGNDGDPLDKDSLSALIDSSSKDTLEALDKISDNYPIRAHESKEMDVEEIFSGTYHGQILFEGYADWIELNNIMPLLEKTIDSVTDEYAQDYDYKSAEHMKGVLSTVDPREALKRTHPKYEQIDSIRRDIVDSVAELYKPLIHKWLEQVALIEGFEKTFGGKFIKNDYSVESDDLPLETRLYSQLIEPITIDYILPKIGPNELADIDEYLQDEFDYNKALDKLKEDGIIS